MTNAPLEKRFAHFLTEISANLISISGKSELDARVIEQRSRALRRGPRAYRDDYVTDHPPLRPILERWPSVFGAERKGVGLELSLTE